MSELWTVVVGILMIAITGLGVLNTLLLQSVEKRIDASNRQLENTTAQLWAKIDRVVNLFESERDRVMALMDKMTDRLAAHGECIARLQTYQDELMRKENKPWSGGPG